MESQLDYLRRRFAYETWRDTGGASKERLSLREILPSGYELAGWRAERIQRVETEGAPPYLTSIWRTSQGETEALVRLDVYESDSPAAAREFLLRLLAEFQSPELKRQEQNVVGDVAFVMPGETMILLAYANLVILIRNAGREVVPVTDIARQLHQDLAGSSTQK